MPNWMQEYSPRQDERDGSTAGAVLGGVANLAIGAIRSHRDKKAAAEKARIEQERYEADEAQQNRQLDISAGQLDVSRGNLDVARQGQTRQNIEAGFRSPTPGGGSGRSTANPTQTAIDGIATIRARTAKGVQFDVPTGPQGPQLQPGEEMTELGAYDPRRSAASIRQEDQQSHALELQGVQAAAAQAAREFTVANRPPTAPVRGSPEHEAMLRREGAIATDNAVTQARRLSTIPNRPSGNPADEKRPTENAQSQRAARFVKQALFQNPTLARDPKALAGAANRLLQEWFGKNQDVAISEMTEFGEQRGFVESETQKLLSTPAAQRAAAGAGYDDEPPGRAQGQSDNSYMNALMDWGMDPAEAKAKVAATKAGG